MNRSVVALSVSGLLVGCGAGIPMHTTGPSLVAEQQATRPVATMRASYLIRSTGKVVVTLASNVRRAKVRYRRNGVRRTVRRQLREGRAVVVLRRGAKSIAARGIATRRLLPSPWVKAAKVVSGRPRTERPNPSGSVRDSLAAAGAQRVFFGHQSVGRNILEAIPIIYDQHGMAPPPIVDEQ